MSWAHYESILELGDRDRTYQARQPAAERPTQAYAPDAEKEATKPPAKNFLQQQAKFDRFIECYNDERPHQALNMKWAKREPKTRSLEPS